MHANAHPEQDPRIRSPPRQYSNAAPSAVVLHSHAGPTRLKVEAGIRMSNQERLSTIQSYAWTLELLGEALVQHDDVLECEHNPQLSFRNTAGIHQAMRIISRLAAEQCGKLLEDKDPVLAEER